MKIGIVNDLPLAVEALRRAIAQRPGCEVAWVAHDGNEAVAMCERDPPDLLFMDLIMPGMDGVEATRRIMRATPCPILIVTVDVGAHASRVFEAMGHGALDAVNTPRIGQPDDVQSLLSKLDVIDKLMGDRQRAMTPKAHPNVVALQRAPLVAIGASAFTMFRTVTLPNMQYNTTSTSGLSNITISNNTNGTLTGNYRNVTIGSNCNITLTGTIFGQIIVKAGSLVRFSQSTVYVSGITLQQGSATSVTQLGFTQDAVVSSNDDINVGSWCIVNPDNYKVVFYLTSHQEFENT